MRVRFINFAIFLLHGLHLTLIGLLMTNAAIGIFAPSDQLFTSGIIFTLIGIMTLIGAAFLLRKTRPILIIFLAFVLFVTLFYLFSSLNEITELASTTVAQLENKEPVTHVEIEGLESLHIDGYESNTLQPIIDFLTLWKNFIVLSGSLLLIPLFTARPRKTR